MIDRTANEPALVAQLEQDNRDMNAFRKERDTLDLDDFDEWRARRDLDEARVDRIDRMIHDDEHNRQDDDRQRADDINQARRELGLSD